MNVRLICPEGHPVVVAADKLGGTAICPHCFTTFLAELDLARGSHARKDEGKSRRARDDDDEEDEEDDRPRKKKPKPRDEDDDEDDKPRRKKRRDDDDDDEEEEPEPAVPGSEEEPIKWTPRKRQLSTVSTGLIMYQVVFWTLLATYALMALAIIASLAGAFIPILAEISIILAMFAVLPLTGVSFVIHLVAWIMMFWAPGKSGARGSAITAMGFFFGPVLLFGLYYALSFAEFFRNPSVKDNFFFLMLGLSCISGLISFFYSLQVLENLASFMGLIQLAKEPVALGWMIIGGTLLTLVLYAGIYFMINSMNFSTDGVMGFALRAPLLLPLAMYWLVLRSLIDLVGVTVKLRAHIEHYIREG